MMRAKLLMTDSLIGRTVGIVTLTGRTRTGICGSLSRWTTSALSVTDFHQTTRFQYGGEDIAVGPLAPPGVIESDWAGVW
jgi:RNase P/RNase MRP subunit p29